MADLNDFQSAHPTFHHEPDDYYPDLHYFEPDYRNCDHDLDDFYPDLHYFGSAQAKFFSDYRQFHHDIGFCEGAEPPQNSGASGRLWAGGLLAVQRARATVAMRTTSGQPAEKAGSPPRRLFG